MLYDGGVDKDLEICVTGGDKCLRNERQKVEHFFAFVKEKFPHFFKGTRLSPSVQAKWWKSALIFVHLDFLCERYVCKIQGREPKKDIVSIL